jgi:hypothetical protein
LFVILSANAFAGTNLGGKQKRIVGSFSGKCIERDRSVFDTGVAEEVVVEADEDIINT